MPAPNRVTPLGEVVAIALPGRWMGNRGRTHGGRSIVRHHRGRRWIICETEYKGWRAAQWSPRRCTPLFFHDERLHAERWADGQRLLHRRAWSALPAGYQAQGPVSAGSRPAPRTRAATTEDRMA